MAEDVVILTRATWNEVQQMLNDWKRKFPLHRPRQRRRSAASGAGGAKGGGIRRAQLAASAGNTKTIIGSLLNETTQLPATSGAEFEATLYADIIGTNKRLDFAVPRLVDGDIVPVYLHGPEYTEWSQLVNYKVGDVVIWDDIFYSALTDHLSDVASPPPSDQWEISSLIPRWYIASLFMSSRTYAVENA